MRWFRQGESGRHVWVKPTNPHTWETRVELTNITLCPQHMQKLGLEGMPGRDRPQYPPVSVRARGGPYEVGM